MDEERLTIEKIKQRDRVLSIYKKVSLICAAIGAVTTSLGIAGICFSVLNKGPIWAKVLELLGSLALLTLGGASFSFTSRVHSERKSLEDILNQERIHSKKDEIIIK